MTTAPSPPNRRRRRIFFALVGISIVLCGAYLWSTRPQIDPNLLGSWAVTGRDKSSGRDVRISVMVLRSDGSMDITASDSTSPFQTSWSVHDGILYIGKDARGAARRAYLQPASEFLAALLGRSPLESLVRGESERLPIRSITPASIVLTDHSVADGKLLLTRLSD